MITRLEGLDAIKLSSVQVDSHEGAGLDCIVDGGGLSAC